MPLHQDKIIIENFCKFATYCVYIHHIIIFLHPVNILFLITLILSIITIISSRTWLIVWVALEINIISFIPLIINKKNKYQAETALKYFIIQAISSIFILTRLFFIKNSANITNIIITRGLILKRGVAPLHQWLPPVSEGLSWPLFFILNIPQKVGPLRLISSINPELFILYFFIVASALIGRSIGLSQFSLRKILIYSSISHISWLLTRLFINNNLWILYFIVYTTILTPIIYIFKKFNLNHLKHIINNKNKILKTTISLNILSLGGLPPFSGFILKFIVIVELINNKLSSNFLIAPLLLSALINLFFYIRVRLRTLTLSNSLTTNFNIKIIKKNTIIYLSLITALTSAYFFII